MKPWLELRDGHIWCLQHKRWWKDCPCPGDVGTTITVTQQMLEAAAPDPNAFRAALEELW